MRLRAILLAALLAAGAAAPAAAQQTQRPDQRQTGTTATEAWYAENLAELANVLGGAHYLRILCQGRGDQRWREYMSGVISREPRYRVQLVEAFNAGYRDEEARYEDCTQTATQAEAELRARGLRIADALRARHAE